MPRKSTALLLIALVAVAAVLGGSALVFSGMLHDIIGTPENFEAAEVDTPDSWSELTTNTEYAQQDVRVNTTLAWTAESDGTPLSIHYSQNDTVTLVYRNKSVRLNSDGSVFNRTRFDGTVVNTERNIPAPKSYKDNIADTPVLIRDNGTYYRFNVSSWLRTRLTDLNVTNPVTEWVREDGLLVKRNDSTAAFVNLSTGETTEYGEVSADIFAVDGNRTLVYASNRTYARFPNGTEKHLFPNGTSYNNSENLYRPHNLHERRQHAVAANEQMVAIAYPDQGGSPGIFIYERDTGEAAWGWGGSAFETVHYIELSGDIAQIDVLYTPPTGETRYIFERYNITNGNTEAASIGPLQPDSVGRAGEYSYIADGDILDISYIGMYRNGTVWHLRADESLGDIGEALRSLPGSSSLFSTSPAERIAVSPDRRSVVASNGSAVFKLHLNRSLK